MLAAQNGHEQVALVLLEAGAAAGFRVLIVAAFHGHMRCARVLLKQKAKGFGCSRWCMGSLHLSFCPLQLRRKNRVRVAPAAPFEL